MTTNAFVVGAQKYSWNVLLETIGGFHKWQQVQYALLVTPLISAHATQYLFDEMQFRNVEEACEENNATEMNVREELPLFERTNYSLFNHNDWY